MDVDVATDPEQMPAPADVERLLTLASARLGPSDAAALARASARLYSWARAIPGAATVSARDGDALIAFGYGYSWDWTSMTDAWALRLADQLGERAIRLENSFSIVLVIVAPDARRNRLGALLLEALADQADEPDTWLQTGADSPLRALCAWAGWQPIDADADPLIMIRSRRPDRPADDAR